MVVAVYPGSFDPITNGHLDIIERTTKIVDKLIVGVLENPLKSPLFTVEERMAHIKLYTRENKKVTVDSFSGLTVDFVAKQNANVMIRGLRAVTDFESEFKMALTNKKLNSSIETLFISTSTEHLFLSSSAVKEIAVFGGDIHTMVQPEIEQMVFKKLGREEKC